MSDKKKNLKRILATAGCGLALAGALLFISKTYENKSKRPEKSAQEVVRDLTAVSKTTLVRDTVDIALKQQQDGRIETIKGEYDPEKDVATSIIYRDITGKDFGKKAVANLNKLTTISEYHEVRHALNERLIRHYDGIVTPYIFVLDEMSARVGEYLAFLGNMPVLTAGAVSVI